MSLKNRIKKIQAYSDAQIDIYTLMVRNYCLLEEGSTNTKVVALFDDSYAAHGFNAVIYQLILAVIKDCSELLFSKDKKSPSTHNILKALQTNAVSRHFERAFSVPPKQNWIGEEPLEDYQKAQYRRRSEELRGVYFDELNDLQRNYKQALKSPLFAKVRKTRNKVIAHFEISLVDEIHAQTTIQHYDIKWDDLETIVRETEKIVLGTYLIVKDSTYVNELLWEHSRRIAGDYWKKLTS